MGLIRNSFINIIILEDSILGFTLVIRTFPDRHHFSKDTTCNFDDDSSPHPSRLSFLEF